MIRARMALAAQEPRWTREFAFLLVDGLSVREDELVAAIAPGLGPVPLFGGSAGDGHRFGRTFVSVGGAALRHAAVLCLIRTDREIEVFSLDHLRPGTTRMVVTEADPRARIVRQINAEPAAREYARVLGKDPDAALGLHLRRPSRWWSASAAPTTSAPSSGCCRTATSCSSRPSTRGWC